MWRDVSDLLTNDRGAALVLTLLVVALITILVLQYHFDAAVEVELADSYASDLQAYYLAMSGLNFARAVLQRDTNEYDAADDLWAMLGTVGCVSPQELLALARDMGEAQESGGSAAIDTEATTAAKTTSRAETTTRAETPSGVEESEAAAACVRITIVDEARKLPMRALVDAQGCTEYASHQAWVAIFERFFEDFKINEDDITDAINALIDWQDASCESPDGSRSGGAEDDYYQGLEKPYSIPYLPMQVPGELRLVRHFTCEALAKLFPGKECKDVADLDLGSNNYLTPYGGWGDEARVNINTATEAVLRALIPDETCIEDILERRGVGFEGQLLDVEPFQDVSQVCGGALPQDANTTIGFRSNYFRVEAIGEVEGLIKKKIVAVLSRSGQGNQPGDGPQMVYFKVE